MTLGTLYIAWIIWLLMTGQAWNEGKNIRDLTNGLYVYESPDGVWICRDPYATLVAPSSFAVTITSMAVIPPYVVGIADERTGTQPGAFFMLDMRTDELVESPLEAEWLEELKKRGIDSRPDLFTPPGK